MTTSSERRRAGAVALAIALAVATGSFAGDAWAQQAEPSAADLESARELYREGKDLRAKGDLRGALERFKAAHGYGQTPVTGLELGKTHLQLGELVEAREVLLSIARLKVASDETEKSAAARDEAADLAEQIRTRIPTIVIKVSGVKPDVTPQVTVDGAPTPIVSLSSIRKANPGDHAIVVRADGFEEKRSVKLAEGETKEVPVAFGPASPRIGGELVSAPPVDPNGGQSRSIHVLTWIGLGVGGAGLVVGTITGALALGKASHVKDACVGLDCPTSAKKDVDAGRTDAAISTIGFIAAGAGIAAAAVGFFVLSPTGAGAAKSGKPSARPSRSPELAFSITPMWSGIHGRF